MQHIPRLVVLELTRRCTLSCIHCRASAQIEGYKDGFSTKDWFRLLDEISSFAKPIIILSGGEALLRDDIFDIISYARAKELMAVIATCGAPLTEEKAERLKQSGIKRVSISIDGKDSRTHDMMRQQKGIFDKAIFAMRILKDKGIEFQINTTVTRHNVSQLIDILEMAVNYGAVSFHPFFLVPIGRAKQLRDMQLSAVQYEEALNWLYEKSKECSISCRPTCAPHYFRILVDSEKHHYPRKFAFDSRKSASLDAKTAGCLGGKSFCFISSEGRVYPCGFLETECGNVQVDSFKKIWYDSCVFKQLRDTSCYKGKCGECEYLEICGGCRARAYEASGDYLEEEPNCLYQPLREEF